MILPCSTLPAAKLAPVVHKLLPGVKRAWSGVFHHAVHRVHHAVQVAAIHPHPLISAGCRAGPAALAGIALAVLPPASAMPPRQGLVSPAGQTAPGPLRGPAADGWMVNPVPAYGGVVGDRSAWPPGGFGSTVTLSPADGSPAAGAPVPTAANFLPHAPEWPTITLPADAGPAMPGFHPVLPATTVPQSVPEPSSLLMFAAALCGFGLIRRRAKERQDGSVLSLCNRMRI